MWYGPCCLLPEAVRMLTSVLVVVSANFLLKPIQLKTITGVYPKKYKLPRYLLDKLTLDRELSKRVIIFTR